jgi:hypothetical protein
MKTPEAKAADEAKKSEEAAFSQPSELNVVDASLYEDILLNFTFDNLHEADSLYQFGTPDNRFEVMKKCNTLILAIELDAWVKAETLSDNLKRLLKDAPEDIKKSLFRLGMSIRKEQSEKSLNQYELLMERLEEEYAKQ